LENSALVVDLMNGSSNLPDSDVNLQTDCGMKITAAEWTSFFERPDNAGKCSRKSEEPSANIPRHLFNESVMKQRDPRCE